MATEDPIIAMVWTKGRVIDRYDSSVWRHDFMGAVMKRSEHGNRDSEYGWEIDHIVPVARGGPNDLENYRPTNWRTNLQRNSA